MYIATEEVSNATENLHNLEAVCFGYNYKVFTIAWRIFGANFGVYVIQSEEATENKSLSA